MDVNVYAKTLRVWFFTIFSILITKVKPKCFYLFIYFIFYYEQWLITQPVSTILSALPIMNNTFKWISDMSLYARLCMDGEFQNQCGFRIHDIGRILKCELGFRCLENRANSIQKFQEKACIITIVDGLCVTISLYISTRDTLIPRLLNTVIIAQC